MPSLRTQLTRRVLAGEKKSAIYNDYAGTPLAKRAAKALALIATPENRATCRGLNTALLVLHILLTLVKLFILVIARLPQLSAQGVWVALIFVFLVAVGFAWLIATFHCAGYWLFIAFGFRGISNLMESLQHTLKPGVPVQWPVLDIMSLLLCAAGIAISLILARKLFPAAGNIFSIPRRDANGNPVFEK